MDPPAEIEILEGVASPTDDGNTPAADAVSMVLDNGDLLLEIMLRLGLPTTLVRSILVCRRWFSVASDPFLLHWFRRFHPPRLLGFYVATRSTTSHALLRPRFVTMPPPQEQEQELADAVRMAETYSLDAYEGDLTCISDLQNDTMLAAFYYQLDEDLQLFIWLHVGGLTWLPIVAISLPEMFETLGITGWTDDGKPATLFQTAQMGDFVEFVFLKLGQCAFCLDTRRMVLRKVYEVTQEDQTLEQLHPLMTTWPPKFPALKADHLARNVS